MTKSEDALYPLKEGSNEARNNFTATKEYSKHGSGQSKKIYSLLLMPFALIIGVIGIVRYKSSGHIMMPSLNHNALHDDDTINIEERIQLVTRSLAAQICTLEFTSSIEGRQMCEAACKNNEKYEPCTILEDATIEIRELKAQRRDVPKTYQDKINDSCSQQSLKILYLKRLCNQLCSPSACCFTNEKCPSGANRNDFCPLYNDCGTLFDLEVKNRKSNKNKKSNKKGK